MGIASQTIPPSLPPSLTLGIRQSSTAQSNDRKNYGHCESNHSSLPPSFPYLGYQAVEKDSMQHATHASEPFVRPHQHGLGGVEHAAARLQMTGQHMTKQDETRRDRARQNRTMG